MNPIAVPTKLIKIVVLTRRDFRNLVSSSSPGLTPILLIAVNVLCLIVKIEIFDLSLECKSELK